MAMDKQKAMKAIVKKLEQFSENEITLFFDAFFTDKEQEVLCQRFLVVKELLNGKPHREIAKELGISVSQITRGSTELKYRAGKHIFAKCFED